MRVVAVGVCRRGPQRRAGGGCVCCALQEQQRAEVGSQWDWTAESHVYVCAVGCLPLHRWAHAAAQGQQMAAE